MSKQIKDIAFIVDAMAGITRKVGDVLYDEVVAEIQEIIDEQEIKLQRYDELFSAILGHNAYRQYERIQKLICEKRAIEAKNSKLENDLEFIKEQLRRQEEEFEPIMKRKDSQIEQLERDNNIFMDCLEFHNNKLPEHICGSNGFRDIEGASCPRCNYDDRKSENKSLEKRYFISFVEEAVLNPEPKYNKCVGGRIEVSDNKDNSPFPVFEEIRFLTKDESYYEFRNKWDFKDIDEEDLSYIRKIVKDKYYGI